MYFLNHNKNTMRSTLSNFFVFLALQGSAIQTPAQSVNDTDCVFGHNIIKTEEVTQHRFTSAQGEVIVFHDSSSGTDFIAKPNSNGKLIPIITGDNLGYIKVLRAIKEKFCNEKKLPNASELQSKFPQKKKPGPRDKFRVDQFPINGLNPL